MADPYTEVADYIASRVTLLDYGTWLVKLSLDDRETTELLTYDKDDGFVWDNDWYEGERDVKVIDFVDTNDVDPSMRWHSVSTDGLPPEKDIVMATITYGAGERTVYENTRYIRDLKSEGYTHQFSIEHPNGIWEWLNESENWGILHGEVVAWAYCPKPYRGE